MLHTSPPSPAQARLLAAIGRRGVRARSSCGAASQPNTTVQPRRSRVGHHSQRFCSVSAVASGDRRPWHQGSGRAHFGAGICPRCSVRSSRLGRQRERHLHCCVIACCSQRVADLLRFALHLRAGGLTLPTFSLRSTSQTAACLSAPAARAQASQSACARGGLTATPVAVPAVAADACPAQVAVVADALHRCDKSSLFGCGVHCFLSSSTMRAE